MKPGSWNLRSEWLGGVLDDQLCRGGGGLGGARGIAPALAMLATGVVVVVAVAVVVVAHLGPNDEDGSGAFRSALPLSVHGLNAVVGVAELRRRATWPGP